MFKNVENFKFLESEFLHRFNLNREYVMSLKNKNLLQNHYFEAGIWAPWEKPCECHAGWEYPTSSVRGQFLGHWMSAAAKLYYFHGDCEAKAKLDKIIDELELCQNRNGGEWVASIPEKNLFWALDGILVGVPHYSIHKTMMGLWDSYEFAGSEKAKDILLHFINYLVEFTKNLSDEQMDDLLDFETGGMLEILANVYSLTKSEEHLTLLHKYERRRLWNPLLNGRDVLTNMHANTTVPEILGAARAFEVTGEPRYLEVVKAYWKTAVENRNFYATGSANSGEVWCPPDDFSSRLGIKTQEHCVQYNMIRLAEFLFRQTGDVTYADYIERSLFNSIFAQQNIETGMVAYYLPMLPGAKKEWGTPTDTFWCCHGTLVQAHTMYASYTAYASKNGISICQYIPSTFQFKRDGNPVEISIIPDGQGGDTQALKQYDPGAKNKPSSYKYFILVNSSIPTEFEVSIRIPWWSKGVTCKIDGQEINVDAKPSTFIKLNQIWGNQMISLEFAKEIDIVKIPDGYNLYAFMDGPLVLAGICNEELTLDKNNAKKQLRPLDARHWRQWRNEYLLTTQKQSVLFKPLSEIVDENYTVYFNMN